MKTTDMRWGTPVFLAFSFLYLFLTLFLVPSTPVFFENDHFIQMYDSVRMLNGEVLYKDFFQFTFPGTEVWYLILFKLFGQRLWLLNATILFLGLGLTWTILAMSKRLMDGVYVYVAPTLFLFFGFRWFGMDGGHRLFGCLFASLALLILLDGISSKRLIGAGILCALSAMFTQTRGLSVFAGIGIFLVWYYVSLRSSDRLRRFSVSCLLFGSAFSISLIILLSYFFLTAGIFNFLESTIFFAQSYAADPVNNSNLYFLFWRQLFTGNFNVISLPVNLFYYALVPAVYLIPPVYYLVKKPVNPELWRRIMLLCLTGLLMFLATTGLSAVRLYHVSIPGIVLISFWWFNSRMRRFALAGSGGVVVFSLALCIWGQLRSYPARLEMPTGTTVFQSETAAEKYQWVNDHTDPGDAVFESYRTVVNFPLSLRNPTSIPMLRNNNYTSPAQVERVIGELKGNPPKYILWNQAWSERSTARDADDHLKPLFDFLTGNYQLVKTLAPVYEIDIEVWEQRR